MTEQNTRGILGDYPKRDNPVRDVKREIERFNALLDFYADRVALPQKWSFH